mgnify:CR=1 FL=1
MKKLLGIVVLGLLLSVNAYAGKYEMEQAAKNIPSGTTDHGPNHQQYKISNKLG